MISVGDEIVDRSRFIIIENITSDAKLNCPGLIFCHKYNASKNNTKSYLFLEFQTEMTKANVLSLLSDQCNNLTFKFIHPKVPRDNCLYFCHIKKEIFPLKKSFEAFLEIFIKSYTHKLNVAIAEKVYSLNCEHDDALRILSFVPNIEFVSGFIQVADSWFDLPILHFSSISKNISAQVFEYFIKENESWSYLDILFQKHKTPKKEEKNIAYVIVGTVEEAKRILESFNFRFIVDSPILVTWFVDKITLDQLEVYRIKVSLKNDEEMNEKSFYLKMSQYGELFKTSLIPNNGGNAVFLDQNNINNVKRDFEIEFCFAKGILYNIPCGTTEANVNNYLNQYQDVMQSIKIISKPSELNLPFFSIVCKTIPDFKIVCEFIAKTPYEFIYNGNKLSIQPFINQTQKNIQKTIQKYNEIKQDLLCTNSIKISNLSKNNCTANDVICLCSTCGVVSCLDINNEDCTLSAIVSFTTYESIDKAKVLIHNSNFKYKTITVSEYKSLASSADKRSKRDNIDKNSINQQNIMHLSDKPKAWNIQTNKKKDISTQDSVPTVNRGNNGKGANNESSGNNRGNKGRSGNRENRGNIGNNESSGNNRGNRGRSGRSGNRGSSVNNESSGNNRGNRGRSGNRGSSGNIENSGILHNGNIRNGEDLYDFEGIEDLYDFEGIENSEDLEMVEDFNYDQYYEDVY